MSLVTRVSWLGLLPFLSGLAAQSPLVFSDVTASSGLIWLSTDPGGLMGAGGAFLDYDQDGDQDVLFVGGDTANALFRNNGNGTFTNVTQAAGLGYVAASDFSMACAIADYDNDGDPDIYVCVAGPNRLYRNNGNGTFSDVTLGAGVADPTWSTGAAFGDYDNDGDLDLYVANYVAVSNFPYHTPFPNTFYRNNGNGTFTDVTTAMGLAGAGTSLAVTWSDYDQDGDQDLLVANDFGSTVERNRLYRNDGPGTGPGQWVFTEVSGQVGFDLAIYCMGIAAGDIDRDLDLDYYFSNLGRNVLLRNDLASGFLDITTGAGVEVTQHPYNPNELASSWGVGFQDFDQDGWLDLYVSNGYIPAAQSISNPQLTPNSLFHHDGAALTFSNVSAAAGVEHLGYGRGAAFGDYDNDGDIDILQCNVGGYQVLFRNDSPSQGAWLKVRPEGRISNKDGQGARVRADIGSVALVREANRNYSYQSSSELGVHFGLGATSVVDRLSLRWPSGVTHQLHHVPARLNVRAIEPVVTVAPTSSAPSSVTQGHVLHLSLVLQNHVAQPTQVSHFLTFVVGGYVVNLPIETHMVPGGGTAGIVRSFYIPAGILGSGPAVPIDAYWTMIDAGGGVDQWKFAFQIAP